MITSTAQFFDNLSRRGREPLLARVDATVRFDVIDGSRTDHWVVRIDHGDIQVAAENKPADCVISGDRAVFDAIIDGRLTAMVALLRGALAIDGDPELIVLAQRLFPGPAAGSPDSNNVTEGR
jgi:putative sterol carrier protein